MAWSSSTYTNYLGASWSPEEIVLTPHAGFRGWHEEVENGEEPRLSVPFLFWPKVKWQSKSHLRRLDSHQGPSSLRFNNLIMLMPWRCSVDQPWYDHPFRETLTCSNYFSFLDITWSTNIQTEHLGCIGHCGRHWTHGKQANVDPALRKDAVQYTSLSSSSKCKGNSLSKNLEMW